MRMGSVLWLGSCEALKIRHKESVKAAFEKVLRFAWVLGYRGFSFDELLALMLLF